MATVVEPIAWNGEVIGLGQWVKPDDMSFSSVVSIYASGNLEDPIPADFGDPGEPSEEEWREVLKEYRQLLGPKPCPSCVKGK